MGKLSTTFGKVALTVQGDVLYRDATVPEALPAGTDRMLLETQGAAANPQWAWASFEIQTDTNDWTDPTGAVFEGRVVKQWNSTYDEHRLCIYHDSKWVFVEMLGG